MWRDVLQEEKEEIAKTFSGTSLFTSETKSRSTSANTSVLIKAKFSPLSWRRNLLEMFCSINEFCVSRNRGEIPSFSQPFNMSPDNPGLMLWKRFSYEWGWIITWIYYTCQKISNCFTNSKKVTFITLGDVKQGEGKFVSCRKYVVGSVLKNIGLGKINELPYHCTKSRNNHNIKKNRETK